MKLLNKIRKLREKKGFTLVELIVVIAIIAILTAVLVPLIGNWTQQAAYTTLQDGAQTVSNSVNNAISKVMMGGAPLTMKAITGSKSGTTLTVKVYENEDASDEMTDDNSTKVATEVVSMLGATMSDNSAFVAIINNGAVTGVIYVTNSTTPPSAPEDADIATSITAVNGFDNAYTMSSSPVGVSGKFKVASAPAASTT